MKDGKIAVMEIKLKTEEVLGIVNWNSLKEMFGHWYGYILISMDVKEYQEEDTREKVEPPEICQQCKWCHNKQCWFNDTFHDAFDGDVDVCFEPEHESIDKQLILDKYWEKIHKLAKEDQKNV